jgi:hypothetical protein
MNEGFADFTVNGSKPAGWRSATFMSNGTISSGTYIWFGVSVDFFWETRFDYGAKCYSGDWLGIGDSLPNTYPMYNVNWYLDFKLSMYFTYTSAQSYVRVLTQGVGLSDNRKLTANYKRGLAQTAGVNSFLTKFQTFFRKCEMVAHNTTSVSRYPSFFRNVTEQIKITSGFFQSLSIFRKCTDGIDVFSQAARVYNAVRKAQDGLKIIDTQSASILFIRSVYDNGAVTDSSRHWGAFIRGLAVTAGSIAETTHKAEYYRFNADTVQVAGAVFRGLLLFVRIVTKVFIRDYLLGRFLKAREEIVLKSAVTREIVLDSRID